MQQEANVAEAFAAIRPHLGVALTVLATVLRAVLDEGTDGGVDDTVVVPPCVTQVALEQLAVVLIGQGHQQRRVTVRDVARLVGLDRVEHRRQEFVIVRETPIANFWNMVLLMSGQHIIK